MFTLISRTTGKIATFHPFVPNGDDTGAIAFRLERDGEGPIWAVADEQVASAAAWMSPQIASCSHEAPINPFIGDWVLADVTVAKRGKCTPVLSELKVVIDGPGNYETRDGRTVTIDSINNAGSFSAKGSIWRTFRGKLRPRGYQIWHPSGRFTILEESPNDIVRRIERPS